MVAKLFYLQLTKVQGLNKNHSIIFLQDQSARAQPKPFYLLFAKVPGVKAKIITRVFAKVTLSAEGQSKTICSSIYCCQLSTTFYS